MTTAQKEWFYFLELGRLRIYKIEDNHRQPYQDKPAFVLTEDGWSEEDYSAETIVNYTLLGYFVKIKHYQMNQIKLLLDKHKLYYKDEEYTPLSLEADTEDVSWRKFK